jgi:hypothetical protein
LPVPLPHPLPQRVTTSPLPPQAAASADRCSALTAELDALRASAERREGALAREAAQAAGYTERALSEAQRGRMGLEQVNAWLQGELDACRAARRQQEAAAVEAQQRAAVLEARLRAPRGRVGSGGALRATSESPCQFLVFAATGSLPAPSASTN